MRFNKYAYDETNLFLYTFFDFLINKYFFFHLNNVNWTDYADQG